MADDFPRQMRSVRIDFSGDLRDVEVYIAKVKRKLDDNYDNIERMGNQLIVYPAANND